MFDKKNGFKLTVRAARDIRRGEHIATCYSNILWGTQLRRQHLSEAKYFTCSCERCADPTELGTHFSSLKCLGTSEAGCEGGIQTPDNPLSDTCEWVCNKCPARVPGNQVSYLTGKMGEEIDNALRKTPNVPALELLLDKLVNFLHPQHYHVFALQHSLIQLYGHHKDYTIESLTVDALKRKLKLCDELLSITGRLDPHSVRLSLYTAVALHEKFNSIAEMHRRQLEEIPYTHGQAVDCLKSAQMILINELDTVEGRQLNDKICGAMVRAGKIMKS